MPRKNKFTVTQVVDAIKDAKGFLSTAARHLDCDYKTVQNYAKRYPTVQEAINEERETVKDLAEGSLFSEIKNGNITAIIFYLKTQGKDRGYVERQEFTGKGGEPLQVKGFHEVVVSEHKLLLEIKEFLQDTDFEIQEGITDE